MDAADLKRLARAVAAGELEPDELVRRVHLDAVTDLGYARIDTARGVRTGVSEVIYGAGKTAVPQFRRGRRPASRPALGYLPVANGQTCRSLPGQPPAESVSVFSPYIPAQGLPVRAFLLSGGGSFLIYRIPPAIIFVKCNPKFQAPERRNRMAETVANIDIAAFMEQY